jgi:hypothetical protein
MVSSLVYPNLLETKKLGYCCCMDKLEENRALYTVERNFRDILKKHILKILQSKGLLEEEIHGKMDKVRG